MSLADSLGRFAPSFDFQLLARVVANLFSKLESVQFPRQAAEQYLVDLRPKLGAADAIEEMLLWQMVLAHFQVLAFSEQAASPEIDLPANAAAARCSGTFARLLGRLLAYRKMRAKLAEAGIAMGKIGECLGLWNEGNHPAAFGSAVGSAPRTMICEENEAVRDADPTRNARNGSRASAEIIQNAASNKDAAQASPETNENAATNKDASRAPAKNIENTATNKDGSQASPEFNENAATNKDALRASAEFNENTATNKDSTMAQEYPAIELCSYPCPSVKSVVQRFLTTDFTDSTDGRKTTDGNVQTNKDGPHAASENIQYAATNKDGSQAAAVIIENAATNKDASRPWRSEHGSPARRRSYHLSEEGRARLRESARQRRAWLASTGPKTREGKNSSRLNAVKTGFYSRSRYAKPALRREARN